MSILRIRHSVTTPKHYVFIVKPLGEFNPTNWRDKPQQFNIIRQVGTMARRGKADAFKFIENQKAIAENTACDQWAISLS